MFEFTASAIAARIRAIKAIVAITQAAWAAI